MQLKRLKELAAAFIAEQQRDWQEELPRRRWNRFAHFCHLVGTSFSENRCPVRACALAYTTLLALIPLLAITMSVATALLKSEGQKPIENLIDRLVAYVSPELNTDTTAVSPALAGSPLLSTNEIRNGAAIVTQLRTDTNALTQYLAPRLLTPAVREASAGPLDALTNSVVLNSALAEALNEVIRGDALYSETRFAGIPLSEATRTLLAANPEGPAAMRLNRLLLEDAFPGDLSKSYLNKRQEVVARITDYIGNIRTGALTISGAIMLVFIAIGLLRTIEAAFNDIWGVARGRGWVTSIIQYWALITLGPLVLILVLGFSSGPYVAATAQWLTALPAMVHLVPFVVLTVAFALLYKLMPNTTVKWRAALIGGVVGGCLWQLNNVFSFLYVSRIVGYSSIYGSLSLVPIFLIGLYVSWLILLLGAQVAYTYQNFRSYLQERKTETVNQHGRELVALHVMTQIAQRFQTGEPPPTVEGMASRLGVPTRLVSQILKALFDAKLIVEVTDVSTRYTPARPLQHITAHDVVDALRSGQGQHLDACKQTAGAAVQEELERVQQAEREVAARVTLEDLAHRATSTPAISQPDS